MFERIRSFVSNVLPEFVFRFSAVVLLLCFSVILSLSKDAFAFKLPDTGQEGKGSL